MAKLQGIYDIEIRELIDKIGAITIDIANGFTYKYYPATARRLAKLEKKELLSSYYDSRTGKKVYYPHGSKPLSAHDFILCCYMYDLLFQGYIITGIMLKKKIVLKFGEDKERTIVPDLFIRYKNPNCREKDREIFKMVEVDYTHDTDQSKIRLYEYLYENRLQYNINKFDLIIFRETAPTLKDEKYNVDIVYKNWRDLRTSFDKDFQ